MAQTGRSTESPEWLLCAGCKVPIYHKRWIRDFHVCHECGHHGPLTAEMRLASLSDPGSLQQLPLAVRTEDVLDFVDTKPYLDRIAEARARTGMEEAVICARATIEGGPVVIVAMDFRFLGGSLGGEGGELITLAAEAALAERIPFLMVTASGGMRMQEGVISLMQMAKTSAALVALDEAGVLTISLITDPTYGGVAASFATLSDVIIAEPRARLGFAGRRAIEQTIGQELPVGFQTAEFLLDRGFIDLIVPRRSLRGELAKLLRFGRAQGTRTQWRAETDPTLRDPGRLPDIDAWDQVRKARSLDRPTTLQYLSTAFTDFQELHGDRVSGDCPAIVGGPALLGGSPVMVIGQQKGHTPAELNQRNFGMPKPAGYRKAVRLMRLAAKLGLPVVTLIDTPGAYPGVQAEEGGQAMAIAQSIGVMASLPVPVLSVVIGEGGSGGALALAVANRVLICANGVYSVISPEGCAAILWNDSAAAPRAASALRMSARSLLSLGLVDGVLPEPDGGTGSDPIRAADILRAALIAGLAELSKRPARDLASSRRDRFRRIGTYPIAETEFRVAEDAVQ